MLESYFLSQVYFLSPMSLSVRFPSSFLVIVSLVFTRSRCATWIYLGYLAYTVDVYLGDMSHARHTASEPPLNMKLLAGMLCTCAYACIWYVTHAVRLRLACDTRSARALGM